MYGISAADNCSAATITILSQDEFSGACAGTFDRVYHIEDECGNETTFQQFILLTDSIAPEVEISCPAADTLQVDALCEVDLSTDVLGMATAVCTDNCDNEPTTALSYTDVLTPLCAGSQLLERTWMAVGEDHCDNTDTALCVQTVLIQDLIAPMVSIACPDTATIELDELCSATADPADTGTPEVTTTDNCGGPVDIELTYTDADTASTCGAAFAFTRTWLATATDSCGNQSTASCNQLIQAVDLIAPEWSNAGLYIYAACDSLTDPTDPTQLAVEAIDNCSVAYSMRWSSSQADARAPMSASDGHRRLRQCISVSQYVVLFDLHVLKSRASGPTLYVDAACETDLSLEALGMATATDNCADLEEITLSHVDAAAVVNCLGDDDTESAPSCGPSTRRTSAKTWIPVRAITQSTPSPRWRRCSETRSHANCSMTRPNTAPSPPPTTATAMWPTPGDRQHPIRRLRRQL